MHWTWQRSDFVVYTVLRRNLCIYVFCAEKLDIMVDNVLVRSLDYQHDLECTISPTILKYVEIKYWIYILLFSALSAYQKYYTLEKDNWKVLQGMNLKFNLILLNYKF